MLSMELVSVDNLYKSFSNKRVQVLQGISFSLLRGSVTGFLGANGAGKTTLIKLLLEFIFPDRGKIKWHPSLGSNFKEVRSKIGYFPERPYFYPHITGRNFLNYTGQLSGIERKRLEQVIFKYSSLLKLTDALDRKIHGYSKGMLQRLGFISAILHDPEILIFDEPLSGLDPLGRQEFKDTLKLLAAEGKTIFFSSHIVPDIEEVCQDVLFLDQGEILYHGAINKLLQKYESEEYKIRYFDKELSSERVEFIKSYADIRNFFTNEDIEVISCEKRRMSLEEIIYRRREELVS